MTVIRNRDGKVMYEDPDKTVRQLVQEHKNHLERADLKGADLHGLDLTGANLYRAVLAGANIDDAVLEGADLRWTDLEHASLLRANLDGANLTDARLSDATFHDARLDGADLTDALVYNTDFFTASLRGTNLTNVYMGHAYAGHTDFTSSDLTDAILSTSSILAQAHAVAPDAGPGEDISLDWTDAGDNGYEALLDHIWEAWLGMDGIEGCAKDTGAWSVIDPDKALTFDAGYPGHLAPWYPTFMLSIPRDPSANPDNPDDDAPTGSVLVTVDGWDLAQAVADHAGCGTTPEVVSSVADLRQEAEDTLENCYGLTFLGPDGLDTDGLDGFIRDMTDWRGGGFCWNADFVDADGQPNDPIDQAARDNGALDVTPAPEAPDAAADGPAASPATAEPGMGI